MKNQQSSFSQNWYVSLMQKAIAGEGFSDAMCRDILLSPEVELLALLSAAFQVRKKYAGIDVLLHIIDNVQNGLCPEDCRYCAQSRDSHAQIEEYPMKSDDEILAEAEGAYKAGAWRHCIVFSGRTTPSNKIERIAKLVKEIKSQYPMQVCVSPGIVSKDSLKKLKDAGLDRINHNLNTSETFYKNICTTHTYQDRVNTLTAAREVGLQICCGVIVGMEEKVDDIIEVSRRLHELKVESIPVNFFIPIKGTPLENINCLTPQYCLRVLCLYRFLNPKAEIRIAAGREYHLRDLEVFSLYPANSLFIDGYLNARGSSRAKTLRMIMDAGFNIRSERPIDELINAESIEDDNQLNADDKNIAMKEFDDLHPSIKTT